MLKLPVYLDFNATTPCDSGVIEAMMPYFSKYFGNAASRSHSFGWQAEEAVTYAREQVASLINAEPNEIIFTSGATEAVNLAIKGVAETYSGKGNHIITVGTEHKAVIDTCKHLEKRGAEITWLPVNEEGLIDIGMLEKSIRTNTILIAVMFANNEIGTIQPITDIGNIAKNHGVLFFSDATQAVGKIPVDVRNNEIHLMAMSAHKIYGPKGVGALYVRRRNPRVKITAQMDGGGHERGMRSGTLNVPGIVGLGEACKVSSALMNTEASRISKLRDKLEHTLMRIDDTKVNGSRDHRLPHVSNMSFRNVSGDGLIAALNKMIAVSSGSACTSASMEPSYVLKALGLDDDMAYGSLRFSLGRFTTEAEIDFVIEEISKTVDKLRELNRIA